MVVRAASKSQPAAEARICRVRISIAWRRTSRRSSAANPWSNSIKFPAPSPSSIPAIAGRCRDGAYGHCATDTASRIPSSTRTGARVMVDCSSCARGRASYVRADALRPLAGLLPQRDLRERLQEVAPTGEWIDTHVELARSAVGDPWRLAVGAHFRGVGFAPVGRAPGLRGLSGMISGTESGGRVTIDTHTAVLTWPLQFEQPIDLVNFKTTLYWKRTAEELMVATPLIELKSRDAALHGPVAWHQPTDGGSPVLTLAVSVDNGNAAQAHAYFPRALLHPNVLAWLDRAFVAGHLPHADVVIQGPVRHFPFRDGTGLFLARMRIDGLTLDYREGWPRAENLSVFAEFRNEGLTARLLNGNVGSIAVHKGDLRFVDFKTAEMQLRLAGGGDGADALGYLRATPLDALAEHAFSFCDASGPVQAEVELFLPFKAFDQRRTLV